MKSAYQAKYFTYKLLCASHTVTTNFIRGCLNGKVNSIPVERQVGIEPTIGSLDCKIAVSENPLFAFVWLLCYRFTTAVYRCPSLRAVTISTLLSCRFRMV